jgi:hypothetical protein
MKRTLAPFCARTAKKVWPEFSFRVAVQSELTVYEPIVMLLVADPVASPMIFPFPSNK